MIPRIPGLIRVLIRALLPALLLAHAAAGSAAAEGEAGHPQLLLRSLEQRLGANPFDPVSLNNLAVIRMAEGDALAAAELLARAHQLAPDNALVEQNHQRLTEWLSRRREAGDPRLETETVAEAKARPFPPEPPPIWPRP